MQHRDWVFKSFLENTSQADGLSKEEPILNGPDSQTFLESGFFRPKMSAESLQDDENVAELANFLVSFF